MLPSSILSRSPVPDLQRLVSHDQGGMYSGNGFNGSITAPPTSHPHRRTWIQVELLVRRPEDTLGPVETDPVSQFLFQRLLMDHDEGRIKTCEM